MGRGRKGIADQSLRKTKRTDSNLRGQIVFAPVKNRETKKYQYLNMPLIL